ncbi:VanZ family protein [Hydrocarboniclastica marina]|uniref:VanZ family protein n=1 Tax=Hydrocarboniclastica marina TaxID=2259620 RepID=A0A4P7XJL7_9ALTE|nr:VanZ family protein [Hydrocarboniclastica marina]QCF27326.1 VanZ family protein [Hydrocarboniclastica marina]
MQLEREIHEFIRQVGIWRALLYPTLILILYLATTSQAYPVPAASSDKVNHIMAFVTLGILLRWSYPALGMTWALLLLVGYGLGIEVIQSALPYRQFSLLDLLADLAGSVAGLLASTWLLRKSQQDDRP